MKRRGPLFKSHCLVSKRKGLGTSENVKINKEMYGHTDAVLGQRLDGMAIHFFVNLAICKWLYLAYC